jgi:hypothetical protein
MAMHRHNNVSIIVSSHRCGTRHVLGQRRCLQPVTSLLLLLLRCQGILLRRGRRRPLGVPRRRLKNLLLVGCQEPLAMEGEETEEDHRGQQHHQPCQPGPTPIWRGGLARGVGTALQKVGVVVVRISTQLLDGH